MRRLAWDISFRRAFKRRIRKNPRLRQRILRVLELLAQDAFDPRLKTHKLRGQLESLWACWVEYDCRIVFAFEPDPLLKYLELAKVAHFWAAWQMGVGDYLAVREELFAGETVATLYDKVLAYQRGAAEE